MKTILFKTATDAKEYASANYAGCTLRATSVSLDRVTRSDPAIDTYSGECSAFEVNDQDLNTMAMLAYWESGEDVYQIRVGGDITATCDNIFDARIAARHAEESHEDVSLSCNGHDIYF